jgi:hypothetical protein
MSRRVRVLLAPFGQPEELALGRWAKPVDPGLGGPASSILGPRANDTREQRTNNRRQACEVKADLPKRPWCVAIKQGVRMLVLCVVGVLCCVGREVGVES